MVSLGSRIRQARHPKRLSLRDLAALVGVGVPHLSKVENGHENPSDALLLRLAEVLDLDPDELLLRAGRVPPWLVDALTIDPDYGLTILDGLKALKP